MESRPSFSPDDSKVCSDAKDAVDLLELVPSDFEALVRLGDELAPLVRPNIKKETFKRKKCDLRNEHVREAPIIFDMRSHWAEVCSYWTDVWTYWTDVLSY